MIEDFYNENKALLESIPGEGYTGDVTGFGNEWRNEFVVDYEPSNDDEDAENEYVLVLAIYETSGKLRASLDLEYRVFEVGCQEKSPIPMDSVENAKMAIKDLAWEWGMHKRTSLFAESFLDKAFSVIKLIEQ